MVERRPRLARGCAIRRPRPLATAVGAAGVAPDLRPARRARADAGPGLHRQRVAGLSRPAPPEWTATSALQMAKRLEGRGDQAAEPAIARQLGARPRRHREAVRQRRLQPPQIPRHLPGLRPRQRHRAQAARRRQALAVHGAGAHPGRAADRRPVPGARRPGRPLCQRLAAGHDPPEHPVSRRRQTRAEGGDRRDQPGAADDVGGVRRCRAHRHDRAGAAARPGAPPAGSRRAAPLDPPAAEDRRLSRDLGRRREGDGGGERPTRSMASATCRANSRSAWRSPRTTRSTC